jgi:16S rRNA (guanine527-N7)-methyltransferase
LKNVQYYADQSNLELSKEQITQFQTYQDLLIDWNQRVNLTAITDPEEIALKHFADSLSLLPFFEEAFKKGTSRFPDLTLIDVGTGAGFPGIPLKITNPSLTVTLMDSLNKRIAFLDAVIQALSLQNCITVHSRAEDGARCDDYRERFDIAVARAVAAMPVLCEYCLPYVKVGGIFAAMKSSAGEELETAKHAIGILGGEIESCHDFKLPESDISRSVIIIRKVAKTPACYPRKAGKPEKTPL